MNKDSKNIIYREEKESQKEKSITFDESHNDLVLLKKQNKMKELNIEEMKLKLKEVQ